MSMVQKFDANAMAEANEKIAELLGTPGGLEKIASDVLPDMIKEKRDYVGFARKVLVEDTDITADDIIKNEDGSFYKQYPKDIGAAAAFYGEEAEAPIYKLTGDIVNVAILTIMSAEAQIDKKRLLIEKIDYLLRSKEKAAQVIAQLEDYKVLNLTEAALKGSGTATDPTNDDQIITTSDTILIKTHLVSVKKPLSKADLELASLVMNPATLDDMLAWDDADLDDTTRRELIESGVKYTLWGTVSIITSRIIPDYVVYGYAEKEYLGVMPVLLDITAELTETKTRLVKGLFLYEFLGFAIFNTKAVTKLILNWTNGDDKIHTYNQPTTGVVDETPTM